MWITQRAANLFVMQNHRHHGKVVGSIFQLGLFVETELVGVAIVGRPVSRRYNSQEVCELTRLCTDGFKNACSKLYAACARIVKEMGFVKIITYILESEDGTSLKAAGWVLEASGVGGTSWSVPSRERFTVTTNLFGTVTKCPAELKQRWSRTF